MPVFSRQIEKVMKYWKKLSHAEICTRVFDALGQNINYSSRGALGLPASKLDEKVFFTEPGALSHAPFLSSLIKNPNHIGCHTRGESEPFFAGTQEIEKELIKLIAEDILLGEADAHDGYVAAGGTEANLQAIWVYRNLYMKEYGVQPDQMRLLFSADAHYSMHKASNLMCIPHCVIPVDSETRATNLAALKTQLESLKAEGIHHIIYVANMMTTMFGSVDDLSAITNILKETEMTFKVHVDGAYGGFVYPFISKKFEHTFKNPDVSSITLDAHKMVQAPYGTGIFLCCKNLIEYVETGAAQYVQGHDYTLSGSRSGANAIAVWMILQTYGPHGWHEKIHLLSYRSNWLASHLDDMKIQYFRADNANIITIKAAFVGEEIAAKHGLVPDSHDGNPQWYKVVVMDHVTVDAMEPLILDLKERQAQN
jgi:tyrosine decarboxylase/aspartate 1-decarboxylase